MLNREIELRLGFPEDETRKVVGVLTKFLPFVNQDNVIIVGGLARRHHLQKRGISPPSRPFNDLDLMIQDHTELRPDVTNEFLIYHYHLPRKSSFYAGLVDPETRVTIDVFDYFHPPVDPDIAQIGGHTLKIRGAEDQLTKTVYDLLKITTGSNISPKDFDSAQQLLLIVDQEKAERIWKMKYATRYPFSLTEGIQIAHKERSLHPERVIENPSRTTEPYVCEECVIVPNSPVSPMEEIIALLGYVDRT